MPSGCRGKILRVDLSARKIWVEIPEKEDKDFYRRYWGGSCLGTYYLLKEIEPGISALDPGNVLVFATSVVTGAEAPGFTRYAVVSKSPLTGGVGEALTEGFWGPELKFCGYDAIVIQGKAKRPVYLSIRDANAEIKDAQAFWGTDTGEATQAIRAELGDADTKVACIGPAGENLVRYASIVSDQMFINARGGMGAVMGSKNLKAIAVRGAKPIDVADADRIRELSKQFEEHFSREFREQSCVRRWDSKLFGVSERCWYCLLTQRPNKRVLGCRKNLRRAHSPSVLRQTHPLFQLSSRL